MRTNSILAAALSLGMAGAAAAAPVTSDAGFLNPSMYDFSEPPSVFSAGPQFFNAGPVGVIYQSTNLSSVYNYKDDYGLVDNGSWNAGRNGYLGTNSSGAATIIILTFDTLLSAVGGLSNYAPNQGDNATMSIFDTNGVLLETFDVEADAPISTPGQSNTGAFRGFLRNTADIKSLRIAGDFFVFDDMKISTEDNTGPKPVPVPASLPLLAGALAAAGLMARRRTA